MTRTHTIEQLCARLDEHVEEILSEWVSLASREPWTRLAPDDRLDDVRELIEGILLTSLCTARDLDVHRRKIESAARHGMMRREQGFDAPLLYAGYHFVREAMRRHFSQCGFDHATAMDALLRVDIATTMATMASLRGFYRFEHEALGRWSDILDEMAQESLHLQPER